MTVSRGDTVRLSCPLDVANTCLYNVVEWYHSLEGREGRRTLLKDVATEFNPLMVIFPAISPEEGGWYTCVVGNDRGRREIATYVDVRPTQSSVRLKKAKLGDRTRSSAKIGFLLIPCYETLIKQGEEFRTCQFVHGLRASHVS